MSFEDRLTAICSPLPGATHAHPSDGELHSWKVGEKMFACMGTHDPGVSVKTPDAETAAMLIDAGVASKAKYFHRTWVRLPETVAEDELRHRIYSSYDLVRASLTKKFQANLAPRETC